MLKKALCGAAAIFLAVQAPLPAKPLFWYEDNNGGIAAGLPDDFERMFTEPDSWKELRSQIDVYYIRGNTLAAVIEKYGEGFIKDHFVKVLKDDDIVLAIDNPGPHQKTLPLLKRCGADIGYIALQSTISKIRADDYKKDGGRLVAERINQAADEIIALKKLYPGVQAGLIDATPTKGRDYVAPYHELARRLSENGTSLDFIHLDCPEEIATEAKTITWDSLRSGGICPGRIKNPLWIHLHERDGRAILRRGILQKRARNSRPLPRAPARSFYRNELVPPPPAFSSRKATFRRIQHDKNRTGSLHRPFPERRLSSRGMAAASRRDYSPAQSLISLAPPLRNRFLPGRAGRRAEADRPSSSGATW